MSNPIVEKTIETAATEAAKAATKTLTTGKLVVGAIVTFATGIVTGIVGKTLVDKHKANKGQKPAKAKTEEPKAEPETKKDNTEE